MRACLNILLLLWVASAAWADDSESKESNWSGDVQASQFSRHFQTPGYSSKSYTSDFYLFAGVLWKKEVSDFRFQVRPEMRGVIGDSPGLPTNDLAFLSVKSPKRLINVGYEYNSDFGRWTQDWMFDFERLQMDYQKDGWSVELGRKPMVFGTLKVFPVWNKFGRTLTGFGGPSPVLGSDVASVEYQVGEVAVKSLSVLGYSSEDSMYSALLTWYADQTELHFLGAYWWQTPVFGVAMSRDLFTGTLTSEFLFLGEEPSGRKGNIQWGLGYEYAFDEAWSILTEGFYQSAGVSSPNDYALVLPSRFDTLRAKAYGFLQLNWQATQLLKLSSGTLANLVDGGNEFFLKGEYSLTENLDLHAELNVPVGLEGTEFSTKAFRFEDGTTLGLPLQYWAGLKYYF